MKEKRTIISDLSRCRAFLQGAAMLWVITFHLLPDLRILGGGRKDILLRAVFGAGYGGCDVFLILSGFGLAISLKKDGNPLRFYVRRMRKLLPAYYLFMVPFLGYQIYRGIFTWAGMAGNLTFTGFWLRLPGQFNWYVQVMVAFYLIAPLIHWIFEKIKSRSLAMAVLLLAAALLQHVWFGHNQMIAVTRLFVFLFGFWLGRHEREELPWRLWHLAVSAAACVMGGYLLYRVQPYITDGNGLFWYPFVLLAPGLCLLAAWLRPFVLKIPGYRYIDKLICLCGICSFEIYLIQSLLIEWIHPPLQGKWQWYLCGGTAILLGIGYHYGLEWVLKHIPSGKRTKQRLT